MAEIANLNEPYTLGEVEELPPLPIGELIDVVTLGAPDLGVTAPYLITNRFPTPPTAIAFLTDVFRLMEEPMTFDGLGPPYILTSAVSPGGDFLEPTTGQIWPRIG
jgi:hypothetical protein